MSMKKTILAVTAMAAMMGGGLPMFGTEPKRRFTEPHRSKTPMLLSGIKHIGPVPKGCKVALIPLVILDGKFTYKISIELLFGSKNGLQKKIRG